jgi:hypothetical protein
MNIATVLRYSCSISEALRQSGIDRNLRAIFRCGMGQQHRVRAKRKRRQAYLQRRKTAARVTTRETRRGATKAKKQAAT